MKIAPDSESKFLINGNSYNVAVSLFHTLKYMLIFAIKTD